MILMTEAQFKRLMERENRKDRDRAPVKRFISTSRGFSGVDIDSIHRNPKYAERGKELKA